MTFLSLVLFTEPFFSFYPLNFMVVIKMTMKRDSLPSGTLTVCNLSAILQIDFGNFDALLICLRLHPK